MALIEDIFKGGGIVTGLAIGVGAAVVAPLVTPILRPIAKTAVKAGLSAYEQGRAAFAELSEATGDLVAEARDEMQPTTTPVAETQPKRTGPKPS